MLDSLDSLDASHPCQAMKFLLEQWSARGAVQRSFAGIQDSVDSYLEVVGLGLYTTRFERNDGRYMIFTNAKLVQMCINNVSRSKVLEKTVKFELDAGFSKVGTLVVVVL